MKKHLIGFIRALLRRRDRALITVMPQLGRPRLLDVFENNYNNEYVRLSTLELCGYEIIHKKIPGGMAEVGVYQGLFAARMGEICPDKKLFLFDTFDGFDAKQESSDRKSLGLVYKRDFSDTSVERALKKISNPHRCVVKKGLFPATAAELDETFCLVSLDADLFDPIYEGLKWFWPRLVKGGFILVHDYNNQLFPGARAAVSRFSKESNVPFVPVTDAYGTVIFAK